MPKKMKKNLIDLSKLIWAQIEHSQEWRVVTTRKKAADLQCSVGLDTIKQHRLHVGLHEFSSAGVQREGAELELEHQEYDQPDRCTCPKKLLDSVSKAWKQGLAPEINYFSSSPVGWEDKREKTKEYCGLKHRGHQQIRWWARTLRRWMQVARYITKFLFLSNSSFECNERLLKFVP